MRIHQSITAERKAENRFRGGRPAIYAGRQILSMRRAARTKCALPTLRLIVMLCLTVARCQTGKAQSVTLTLGSSGIHFPNADPATTPSIAASENPVPLTIAFTGIGHWALSVIAGGDLTAGAASIPISNITWTVSGPAFVSGTMSKSAAQPLSAGALTLPAALGSVSFFLKNSWTYPAGTYTQTFTLTLSSF